MLIFPFVLFEGFFTAYEAFKEEVAYISVISFLYW